MSRAKIDPRLKIGYSFRVSNTGRRQPNDKEWANHYDCKGDADAILDRIVHDSYTIEIRGADDRNQKSMQEVYGLGSK